MKKILPVIIVYFYCLHLYAQGNPEKFHYRSLVVDVGADYTSGNSRLLDRWARSYGQSPPGHGASGHITISYFSKHFGGVVEEILSRSGRK